MLIGSSRRLQVYACTEPVDMRKGFDSLAALVREQLGRDPTDGSLYLFVSRNRIRAKVLLWDGTGLCLLCLYSKRLEEGRFAALWKREKDGEVMLSMSELTLYLEGCEEVGKRPISPPEIDPNRQILGPLSDSGPVVGRKNFYGNRSKRGAKTAAILYSLIETAKLCGVNPSDYLRDTAVAAIRRPGTVTLPF